MEAHVAKWRDGTSWFVWLPPGSASVLPWWEALVKAPFAPRRYGDEQPRPNQHVLVFDNTPEDEAAGEWKEARFYESPARFVCCSFDIDPIPSTIWLPMPPPA
jgi:hypothetical protein